jgi:hypothetical protein
LSSEKTDNGIPVKAIIILLLLTIIVWIPYLLNLYNGVPAIALTVGFIIAGLICDRIIGRNKP